MEEKNNVFWDNDFIYEANRIMRSEQWLNVPMDALKRYGKKRATELYDLLEEYGIIEKGPTFTRPVLTKNELEWLINLYRNKIDYGGLKSGEWGALVNSLLKSLKFNAINMGVRISGCDYVAQKEGKKYGIQLVKNSEDKFLEIVAAHMKCRENDVDRCIMISYRKFSEAERELAKVLDISLWNLDTHDFKCEEYEHMIRRAILEGIGTVNATEREKERIKNFYRRNDIDVKVAVASMNREETIYCLDLKNVLEIEKVKNLSGLSECLDKRTELKMDLMRICLHVKCA